MLSHSIVTVILVLILAGGMALIWPFRKKSGSFRTDVGGPGSAIDEGHRGHSHEDGFSSSDH
jgi:hypothetical protein